MSMFKDIPVDVGIIYEGERIRRHQMHVELGGPKVEAKFELVKCISPDSIEDEKITVIGPDLKDLEAGGSHPFGMWIEVAGKEVEEDLEGVIERRIHEFCNFIEGFMHLNQRYDIWLRLGKKSFEKGMNSFVFIGKVLHRLFKSDLPFIEQIQTTFFTDPDEVKKMKKRAMEIYEARDAKARGLTDEDVKEFYGCTLCQSFAPTHCCVITPQRYANCGAISWFDGRAAARVDPKGPIFKIERGECINELKGEWSGSNRAVKENTMGKGTAFGKTILIGDQFVNNEVPAIVSAIPFETLAEVEKLDRGDGWILEDNRIEVPGYKEKKKKDQIESISHILEVMKIDVKKTPIKITYGGTLLAGSGVGASAASCVSLARALNDEFHLGLSIDEINHVGWEGEFAYHGTPSGVDNTASTYGGIIFYRIINGQKTFDKIPVKEPFEIVLANSGITADTKLMDNIVKRNIEEDPDLFKSRLKTIAGQSHEMKQALEAYDLKQVGRLMTENHSIVKAMGYSHEILDHLCQVGLEKGALGTKVTGGGMGGYMISLTPGKDLQESVANAFENEGYKVIRAAIGGS